MGVSPHHVKLFVNLVKSSPTPHQAGGVPYQYLQTVDRRAIVLNKIPLKVYQKEAIEGAWSSRWLQV